MLGSREVSCVDVVGEVDHDALGVHGQMAGRTRHREQVPAPVAWTKTFTDPRLCAAITETGTDSYRLAQTKARAEQASSI